MGEFSINYKDYPDAKQFFKCLFILRETEAEKGSQAGSVLSAQSPMRGSISGTVRS